MKRLFMVGSVLASTFLLANCASGDIEALSKHLQERNCQTQGTVILGGLTPASGQMSWTCPKPE